ncbi:MAG: hypothetical protein ACREPM_06405 [Gemmatimonadaceae bacterium]
MRFDRKLLLIAPTIILFFVVAGVVYAAVQLHVLGSVSETWKERSAFIASVESGQKTLETRQAVGLLRIALDVEARRTAAITASRDLLIALSVMAFACCCVLAIGIRGVPREHWPRVTFGRERAS